MDLSTQQLETSPDSIDPPKSDNGDFNKWPI